MTISDGVTDGSTPGDGDRRPLVLAVMNDESDAPAMVGAWLEAAGVGVREVHGYAGERVPTAVPQGISGVVTLGGAMAAYELAEYPWLAAEQALMIDAIARTVPVLGICLGGQLLAAAVGGTVELGSSPEIGLARVRRTAQGDEDAVIAAIDADPMAIPAAEWHQDYITSLPADATLLLTSDACPVQAFRIGESAYGLQMHPEVDGPTFASWLGIPDQALERSGIDIDRALRDVAQAEEDLLTAWRPMVSAWARLVRERAARPT